MRSYIRHPSDIPIECQADEQAEGASQERLNDISAGGLSFNSTRALKAGSQITIRITNVEPDFIARAQVVWCRAEGGGFVIGVTFADSSDLFRARMVEQVCHIEHYKAEVLAAEGRQIDGEQAAQEWIQKFAPVFPRFDKD
ncbi:hypothetical protein MNBD_GAMMA13-1250 [hydrothermal vent metagenome]|uniref:PilZ domain-containing protein n=1 Tax=hydrothermal vent metagenome TaxID=652676 RepID=A0A3B0YUB3_9ZZZZ